MSEHLSNISNIYNLLFLGDKSVGQNVMLDLLKFKDDPNIPEFIQSGTGLRFKSRTDEIEGRKIMYRLCYMPGKNKLRKIARINSFPEYSEFIGFYLVYSISNERSFADIKRWVKKIKKNYPENTPEMVIVGNKCDTLERKIPRNVGKEYAKSNNISFFEVDSIKNLNIENSFLCLSDSIILKKPNLDMKNLNNYKRDKDQDQDQDQSKVLPVHHAILDEYGFEVNPKYMDEYNRFNKKNEVTWRKDVNLTITFPKEKLRTLIISGIPKDKRPQVWMISSGALRKKINANMNCSNGSLYNTLRDKTVNLQSRRNLTVLNDIKKDLDRTFPNHPLIDLSVLERVLTCFSRRNKCIGYCQGLNFIASWILINLKNEEDAFWLLTTIAEDICAGFWSETMINIRLYDLVMKEILLKKYPNLSNQLEHFELSIDIIATKWFICLFMNAMPTETTIRLWDLFLMDGVVVLFKALLYIISLCEKEILLTKDSIEICEIIKDKSNSLFDSEKFIQGMMRMNDITDEKISQSREFFEKTFFAKDECVNDKDIDNNNNNNNNMNNDISKDINRDKEKHKVANKSAVHVSYMPSPSS